MTPDTEPVSWSHTTANARSLRALAYLGLGVVAGLGLLAVGGLFAVAARAALSGRYAVGGFAVLFLLLAYRFAHYVPLFESRRGGFGVPGLRRRWVLAAAIPGAGVVAAGVAASAAAGALGFFAVVFGAIAVPLVAVSALASEGELDPDALTMTYCGADVDLAALAGVRRFAVGGLAVYWLSYVPGGAALTTPRFVAVPADADPAVREAFAAGVAADPGEYDATPRAVRAALAAFGLLFVGFAAFLLTVEPTGASGRGRGVLYYAALVTGTMGALFVLAGVLSR